MEIQNLRNATLILTLGRRRLLVDPMLGAPGTLAGFKLFGGGRRPNPLVPLPEEASKALDQITDVVVTHEHPDHLDRPAINWILSRGLPVWAAAIDVQNLRKKGLDVRLATDGALGMGVNPIPARHGQGLIGWLMGPVTGFLLTHPEEPSVYLTSDAVMSATVDETIDRFRPDVIVAPAGSANFGVGSDILFSVDELITLVRRAPGQVVLNHLEALDHCPTTRAELRERIISEGLASRVWIPDDGETLVVPRRDGPSDTQSFRTPERPPGFQKWLTSFFTGT